MSAWGAAFVLAATHSFALKAQMMSPLDGIRPVTDVRASHAALFSDRSGSHRVRIAGIIGGAIGLGAGVLGANMLGYGDVEGRPSALSTRTRATLYLGASGSVIGWVIGTTGALPFHGRNVLGPHDVRNATLTGGAVGMMAGVAAGSLMGFKCVNGCTAARSPGFTIAVSGLIGAGVGAVLGRGVGMMLPH
jgi:hypothetical protein